MITEDQQSEANKTVADLCFRIERMCRYSPLDDNEIDGQSLKDRQIVAGLYYFYRHHGDSEEMAARKSRASAIRLILCEAFS